MNQNKSKLKREILMLELEKKQKKLEKLNSKTTRQEARSKSNTRNWTNLSIIPIQIDVSSLNKSSKITSESGDGFKVPNPITIIYKSDCGKEPDTSVETVQFKNCIKEVEILEEIGESSVVLNSEKEKSRAKFSRICQENSLNLTEASMTKVDEMPDSCQFKASTSRFDSTPVLSSVNNINSDGIKNKSEIQTPGNVVTSNQHSISILPSKTSDSSQQIAVTSNQHNNSSQEIRKIVHFDDDNTPLATTKSKNYSQQSEEFDSQQSLDSQSKRKSSRKRNVVNYARVLKPEKKSKVDVAEIAIVAFEMLTQMAKDLPQEDFELPLMYIQSKNRRFVLRNSDNLYTDSYSQIVNFSLGSSKVGNELNATNTCDMSEEINISDGETPCLLAVGLRNKHPCIESPLQVDKWNDEIEKSRDIPEKEVIFEDEIISKNTCDLTKETKIPDDVILEDETNDLPVNGILNESEADELCTTNANEENAKEDIEAVAEEITSEDEMADLPLTLKNETDVCSSSSQKELLADGTEAEKYIETFVKEVTEAIDEKENFVEDGVQELISSSDDSSVADKSEGSDDEIHNKDFDNIDEEENIFECNTQDLPKKDNLLTKSVLEKIIEPLPEKFDRGISPKLSQAENDKLTIEPEETVPVCKSLSNEVGQTLPMADSNELEKALSGRSIDKTPQSPANHIISINDQPSHDDADLNTVAEEDNADLLNLDDQNLEDIIGPTQESVHSTSKTNLLKELLEIPKNCEKCQEAKAINKNETPKCRNVQDDSGIFEGKSTKTLFVEENENITGNLGQIGKPKIKSKSSNVLKEIFNNCEDVERNDMNQFDVKEETSVCQKNEKCVEECLNVKVNRASCFRCSKREKVQRIHFIESNEPLIVAQQLNSLTIFDKESKILDEICLRENILNSFLIKNYIILVVDGNDKHFAIINSNNFEMTELSIPNCLPEVTKVLACPLENSFFATCPIYPNSCLLTIHKIRDKIEFGWEIKSRTLQKPDERINDILRVHNAERTVAGIVENGIFFWSYYSGMLLRKVRFDKNISPFSICWIHLESGLFYYIVNYHKLGKRCCMVTNPLNGNQQVLKEYENGTESSHELDCYVSKVFYVELVANKKFTIYNLLSGKEVASHECEELSASKVIFQKNQQHVALAGYDSGVVHLYSKW